jgi:hypothetical protein
MSVELSGIYPFGERLHEVVQQDRGPKRIFVLGVYASAVHARWVDASGRLLIRALAVASEPGIFWDGAGAETIVGRIGVPAGAGKLEPASAAMNGPSGRALDDSFLQPLGYARTETWLCDLVPHTCLNPSQARALAREYVPRAARFGLPTVDLPPVPKTFATHERRAAILGELEESRAETIVLLGDQPIRHWLAAFNPRWQRLSDFGDSAGQYGQKHATTIEGRHYEVLPLAHPRQVAGLGSHSPKWRARHEAWRRER